MDRVLLYASSYNGAYTKEFLFDTRVKKLVPLIQTEFEEKQYLVISFNSTDEKRLLINKIPTVSAQTLISIAGGCSFRFEDLDFIFKRGVKICYSEIFGDGQKVDRSVLFQSNGFWNKIAYIIMESIKLIYQQGLQNFLSLEIRVTPVLHLDQGISGKKRSKDCWIRVLTCECGRTFHKYKWRVNQSGEECCGYTCWNQINNRKKSYRIANGLDASGYCDVPTVCEWKLDFMLKSILHRIWNNPKETVTVLIGSIADDYVQEQEGSTEQGRLRREHDRLKCRLERLLDMRLDDRIEESQFTEKQSQLQERMAEVEEKLKIYAQQDTKESTEDVSGTIARVSDMLEHACDLGRKKIDDKLIDTLVERVTPTETGIYRWYLNCDTQEETVFAEKDYILYDAFCLSFEEAKAYRKQYGNFIRKNQWKDLNIEVYIRK